MGLRSIFLTLILHEHGDMSTFCRCPRFSPIDISGRELIHKEGHIPGAIKLPESHLKDRVPEELSKDNTIVIYSQGYRCRGSANLVEILCNIVISKT